MGKDEDRARAARESAERAAETRRANEAARAAELARIKQESGKSGVFKVDPDKVD